MNQLKADRSGLIDRRRLYSEADALLKKLGLDVPSRTPLSRLSLAQQQLVEIARAISTGARIVIMDEPTSSLSLTETHRLLEIIKDLKVPTSQYHFTSPIACTRLRKSPTALSSLETAAMQVRWNEARSIATEMVRMMVGRDLKELFTDSIQSDFQKQYPEWFAVQSLRTQRYPNSTISFNVARGEVLGVAGLVGSGRSEMARTIFGVDEALEATVKLNGETLKFANPRDAISHGVYLVPEDRRNCGLVVELNVRENISLPNLESYSTAKNY